MIPRRVLFVCSGNTCRSPLAEVLARERAAAAGLEERLSFRSAGTFAGSGMPASEGARQVARERGLDLEGHRSAPVTKEAVGWADMVLCMTAPQLRAVEELTRTGSGGEGAREGAESGWDADLRLVTDLLPETHPAHAASIGDPYGGDLQAYRETADLLRECVHELVRGIASGGREDPVDEADGRGGPGSRDGSGETGGDRG